MQSIYPTLNVNILIAALCMYVELSRAGVPVMWLFPGVLAPRSRVGVWQDHMLSRATTLDKFMVAILWYGALKVFGLCLVSEKDSLLLLKELDSI